MCAQRIERKTRAIRKLHWLFDHVEFNLQDFVLRCDMCLDIQITIWIAVQRFIVRITQTETNGSVIGNLLIK